MQPAPSKASSIARQFRFWGVGLGFRAEGLPESGAAMVPPARGGGRHHQLPQLTQIRQMSMLAFGVHVDPNLAGCLTSGKLYKVETFGQDVYIPDIWPRCIFE